jgi:hypothetical protein
MKDGIKCTNATSIVASTVGQPAPFRKRYQVWFSGGMME